MDDPFDNHLALLLSHSQLMGSIGVGLVWGWLMGSCGPRIYRLIATAFSTATILLTFLVFELVNWRSVIAFLCATGLALLLNLVWRRELRERYGLLHS